MDPARDLVKILFILKNGELTDETEILKTGRIFVGYRFAFHTISGNVS
jgi:hypothetical protein